MLASWGTFWPTFACSQPFLNIWLGPIFPPRATERYPWEFGETMAETLVSSTSPCYFLSQLFSLLVRSPLPPGCSQRRPEYPLQMKMMFLTSLISREVREKICIIGRIVSPLFSIFYRIFRPKLSSRLFRPPKRKKNFGNVLQEGENQRFSFTIFFGSFLLCSPKVRAWNFSRPIRENGYVGDFRSHSPQMRDGCVNNGVKIDFFFTLFHSIVEKERVECEWGMHALRSH